MKAAIVYLILILAICQGSFAQKNQQPAFIMLDDVLVTAADPRYAPLFDTLTGNGKGSFVSDLFGLIWNGQLEAVADMEETQLMTIQEVEKAVYKKPFYEEDWSSGDTPDTIVTVEPEPQTLKNILAFRLYYVACYDQNMKLISRTLTGFIPMYCEKDRFNEFRGWRRTVYFGLNHPAVQSLLAKNCPSGKSRKTSYLVYLNQLPVDELAHESHYLSYAKANSVSNKFSYSLLPTPLLDYPETISAKAKMIEKKFIRNNEDVLFNSVFINSFFKLQNGPDKIVLNTDRDISDFPMFSGNELYGFLSVSEAALLSVSDGNTAFSASTGALFDEPLTLSETIKRLTVCDTFSMMDPYTGEWLPDTIVCYTADISGLRLIEMKDGESVFPIAVCLEMIDIDYEGNVKGTLPLVWIPLNTQFALILESAQAYLPGYPQQMSLWGYLLSYTYKGETVSERPLDNAEWQKIREVLK